MKKVILPSNVIDNIDLSEIDSETSGLLICYRGGKAVGYIVYEEDLWIFYENVNLEDPIAHGNSLYELVVDLTNNYYINDIQLMEFEQS